jgi:cleavage stimulation factor subunit 3
LTQKPESVARSRALFLFFHEYESRYGDLAQIVKLEKRMNDLFPGDPQLARFAQRFSIPTFDPTSVRPVISIQAQMKPKMLEVVPTVEEPQAPPPQAQESRPSPILNSPRVPAAAAATTATAALLPISNSPKRPFEDVDNELAQPRKLVRGESPLKGAAGRRLDAARRNLARASDVPSAPPPPPLPRDVNFLLNIIPHARHYDVPYIFNPQKLVAVFQAINLPRTVASQPAASVPVPQPPQVNQPMSHWGQPQGGMGGESRII